MENINREMYGEKQKIENYFKREKYWRTISKKIINQIKKYKKIGKLLDVGCFCGLFLDEAREAGFKVYGIEKERVASDYAKKRFGLKITNEDFENFKNGKFDIITFIDVLEHLPNLKNVLRMVSKMLNKDGILFIQCPNINSLVYKITQEKWNWLLPNIHLYHFSVRSLRTVLEENGFGILSVITYDDISEFAYNLIDVLGIKKRNILEKMVWKSLRIFFLIVLKLSFVWCYFGYGGAINLVAKKSSS
jgi:2-polyprenyl-3-methyl-5-hydroxy-6-metoxy-1,4-benzoquinol methylase